MRAVARAPPRSSCLVPARGACRGRRAPSSTGARVAVSGATSSPLSPNATSATRVCWGSRSFRSRRTAASSAAAIVSPGRRRASPASHHPSSPRRISGADFPTFPFSSTSMPDGSRVEVERSITIATLVSASGGAVGAPHLDHPDGDLLDGVLERRGEVDPDLLLAALGEARACPNRARSQISTNGECFGARSRVLYKTVWHDRTWGRGSRSLWPSRVLATAQARAQGLPLEGGDDVPRAQCAEKTLSFRADFVKVDRLGGERKSRGTVLGKKLADGLRRVVLRFDKPTDVRGTAMLMIEAKRARATSTCGRPTTGACAAWRRAAAAACSAPTSPTTTSRTGARSSATARPSGCPTPSIAERAVYVVSSVPTSQEASAYEKVVTSVDRETCVVAAGRLVRAGRAPAQGAARRPDQGAAGRRVLHRGRARARGRHRPDPHEGEGRRGEARRRHPRRPLPPRGSVVGGE